MEALMEESASESLVGCAALERGEVLRVDDSRAVLVQVAGGRVWITEEGMPEDIFLGAKDCHRLTRRGAALIEALGPARIVLTSPDPADHPARMTTLPRPELPRRPGKQGVLGAAREALIAGVRSLRRLAVPG